MTTTLGDELEDRLLVGARTGEPTHGPSIADHNHNRVKKRAPTGAGETVKEDVMAYRARKKRNGAGGGDGPSLHERITQKIVEQLKTGKPPWVKPWNCKALVGMPRN